LKILLVEDDPFQLDLASGWLQSQAHSVVGCRDAQSAMSSLGRESFDVAVLDWMMPDINGEELLGWIRSNQPEIAVMFATARDQEDEIVQILDAGADDYLIKPLRPREFVARVEALGRRARPMSDLEGAIAPYGFDPVTGEFSLHGRSAAMTPRMRSVASVFFRNREKLISRRRLHLEVWGQNSEVDSRSLDTHVSRIRNALELDGRHGWRLASVYQKGYRLEKVLGSN
jgi:two-component system, OmpR family, response regulator RegX3